MKKLLSYLAPAAVVLLASCSSEPSDWRPDQKVSLDTVAPGTRDTENYDHTIPSGSIENTHSELMQEAMIENGLPSHDTNAPDKPTAESTVSANSRAGKIVRDMPADAKAQKQAKSGLTEMQQKPSQLQQQQ